MKEIEKMVGCMSMEHAKALKIEESMTTVVLGITDIKIYLPQVKSRASRTSIFLSVNLGTDSLRG